MIPRAKQLCYSLPAMTIATVRALIEPHDLERHPLARAHTLPAQWYVASDFYAFELSHLFPRCWQYVGHCSQLPSPGCYLVADVAGRSVVVVRDQGGALRAFHNVCRHRAGPLATRNGCGARVLQCQYHGWTYTLEGHLRGIPHWDRVDLFDRRDYGLLPLFVEEWEGLIFVSLEQPLVSLSELLAGIRERIAPTDLRRLHFHTRVVYPIACNWKAYVDNYLEGYHVPIVHPELNKVLDYTRYVTETYRYYSLQYSPFRADSDTSTYGQNAHEAFYYFIFPNMMLNIVGSRLQVNLVQPLAAERCEVIFDYCYEDVCSEAAQAQIAADITYSDTVQREDGEICEWVQRGLRSGAYRTGRYSVEREEGVYHFHELLRDWLRIELAEG